MKFPVLPIGSHSDSTLNFQKLQKELNRPWVTPENFNSKLEETGTIQARQEGVAIRLKGKAKTKELLIAANTLFVLPVGLRPPAEVRALAMNDTTGALVQIVIETNGVVKNAGELATGQNYSFDTITFQRI